MSESDSKKITDYRCFAARTGKNRMRGGKVAAYTATCGENPDGFDSGKRKPDSVGQNCSCKFPWRLFSRETENTNGNTGIAPRQAAMTADTLKRKYGYSSCCFERHFLPACPDRPTSRMSVQQGDLYNHRTVIRKQSRIKRLLKCVNEYCLEAICWTNARKRDEVTLICGDFLRNRHFVPDDIPCMGAPWMNEGSVTVSDGYRIGFQGEAA